MLLVNQKQISEIAGRDDQNEMHSYAKEYKAGIEYLRETYGSSIKFVRPGYPHKVRGVDPRGKEVPNLAEPTPPLILPLNARVQTDRGEEFWSYCEKSKLLPNSLWEPVGKRSLFISENITVVLKKSPELAFFLYYKSPIVKSGQLKVYDPATEAKMEGDKARADLDLQTAIYGVLGDEDQLKVVAQAYGVAGTDKKHPDIIRKELKNVVLQGEVKRRSDPTAKGVKEFLEELKVTDSVRLRSLVMTMIENKKITWPGDGRYKVGERELCRVPGTELTRRQDYLTNHLINPANRTKLQELLRDVVNEEYLDKISDDKTFTWLAKTMGLQYNFKSAEDIKELVYNEFVPNETGEKTGDTPPKAKGGRPKKAVEA